MYNVFADTGKNQRGVVNLMNTDLILSAVSYYIVVSQTDYPRSYSCEHYRLLQSFDPFYPRPPPTPPPQLRWIDLR